MCHIVRVLKQGSCTVQYTVRTLLGSTVTIFVVTKYSTTVLYSTLLQQN